MMRSLNFWLFLLLLVCGASFWAASRDQEQGGDSGGPPVTSGLRSSIHVRVLNGTEVSGLAREVSLAVVGHGCVVEGIGNAPGPWAGSLLVNRRLEDKEAVELARRCGGVPVIRQWDGRCGEDAVLILGEDHARILKALDVGVGGS